VWATQTFNVGSDWPGLVNPGGSFMISFDYEGDSDCSGGDGGYIDIRGLIVDYNAWVDVE
jgi:hypothetical protein